MAIMANYFQRVGSTNIRKSLVNFGVSLKAERQEAELCANEFGKRIRLRLKAPIHRLA